MKKNRILEVNGLSVRTKEKGKKEKLIRNISFSLQRGECLGILGESGSGKSMSMKAILGLLDKNFEIAGSVEYKGVDLLKVSPEKLRQYRGKNITMILQNPMICFDPLYRIGDQIEETWIEHKEMTKEERKDAVFILLEKMQLGSKKDILYKYPHQLSGGMLQRIMIGLALSMEPDILVADEPTTAIDAITQYQIMKEFQKIKAECKTSMIFISHDLGVISTIADRILVMNHGCIVDEGDFTHIMEEAEDDYTKQLVRSKKMVMKRYHQVLHQGGFHDSIGRCERKF
jgi:nickel transport system ATP-binding protein